MLYVIRFFKYLIYYCVIALFLLAVVFLTSDLSFWELTPKENYWKIALFLSVFAAVYPLIGFVSRKVYLNRPFSNDKDALIEPLLRANYQIVCSEEQKITLRPKSAVTRFTRLYEDKITIDFSDNPIVVSGLRKEVYRFARSMEYVVQQMR